MRRPVSVRISSFTRPDAGAEGLAQDPAQHRRAIEDLLRVLAQDRSIFDGEKPPRGLRDQHRAPAAGEEKYAILQVAENLVEIFLQRGEDLFHVAHALADLLDLGGDAFGCVVLRSGSIGFRSFACGCGPVVELQADLFHRTQRQIAEQEGRQQSGSQRKAHQRQRLTQPGRIDGAQQRGAHSHMHRGKGLAVALQRHHHVKDPGRTEDLPIKLNGIGVQQLLVVGARRAAACLRCRDWC